MNTHMNKSIIAIGIAAMIAAPMVSADPTSVQFSPDATGDMDVAGSYGIVNIHSFDWQASGDLVVENKIPDPNNCRIGGPAGAPQDYFAEWAAAADVGDTCAFNMYAHARLTAFKKPNQQAITLAPANRLSKDGLTCAAKVVNPSANCFEVTGAVDALETATLVTKANLATGVNPKIEFKSITGAYKFFLDNSPDSVVKTPGSIDPTTFTDGTPFLEGTLASVTGSFTATTSGGGGGSNYIVAGVGFWDPTIIRPHGTLTSLSGTSFDTLVQVGTSLTVRIDFGEGIGLTPYVVLQASSPFEHRSDLRFKADANTIFEGFTPPVELQCRVTGGGREDTANSGLLIANNLNNPFDTVGGMTTNETPFGSYTPCFASVSAGVVVYTNCDERDEYTFGGQAGAPTKASGPFGEWEHTNHEGPSGVFTFKMGSHSAPKETLITDIECSDPPACAHAKANGKVKQIDFEGTGSFRNLQAKGPNKPTTMTINGAAVRLDNDVDPTRHYARVHIEDLGEDGPAIDVIESCIVNHTPGANADGGTLTSAENGTPDTGEGAICSTCPDIYQIEIHATEDRTSPVIYTVGSYTNKGNLQMHQPTGKPAE